MHVTHRGATCQCPSICWIATSPRRAHSCASRTRAAARAGEPDSPADLGLLPRRRPLQSLQVGRRLRIVPRRSGRRSRRRTRPAPRQSRGDASRYQPSITSSPSSIGTHRGRGPEARAPLPKRTCSLPNGPRSKCTSARSSEAPPPPASRRETACERGRSRAPRRALAGPGAASLKKPKNASMRCGPAARRRRRVRRDVSGAVERSSGSSSRTPNSASISTDLRAYKKRGNPGTPGHPSPGRLPQTSRDKLGDHAIDVLAR